MTMRVAPLTVAGAVLLLAAGAAAGVLGSARRDPARAAASAEFQSLVGGLGLGAALDLSGCDAAFDPRVGAPCPDRDGPFPGGARFCPHLGGPEVRQP